MITVLQEEELERREIMMVKRMARLEMSKDGGVRRVGGYDDDNNDDDNDDDNDDGNDNDNDDNDDDDDDDNDDDDDDDDTNVKSNNQDHHPRAFKDYSEEYNGQNRNVLNFLCDRSPLSLITKSNFNTTPIETG